MFIAAFKMYTSNFFYFLIDEIVCIMNFAVEYKIFAFIARPSYIVNFAFFTHLMSTNFNFKILSNRLAIYAFTF